MPKVKVLIIDDAAAIRRLLADALAEDEGLEVVGLAVNGRIGLEMIVRAPPDVVVLDLEMPELGGLETLREIRRSHPRLAVVVFSGLTQRGAAATLDALAIGANDYVAKPSGGPAAAARTIREELAPKLKFFGRRPGGEPRAANPTTRPREARRTSARPSVVVIGISTGGPNALAAVIPRLPANFPAPILIVQHMPPIFTRMLAERLDAASALKVREAVDGLIVGPGDVVVAAGDWHLRVSRLVQGARVRLDQGPPMNSCRPAADALFLSAAETYRASVLGVVMTGMGQDGLRGSEAIHAVGGRVLAQDEATSVVWGMPAAVVRADLADEICALDEMARRLIELARGPSLLDRHSA